MSTHTVQIILDAQDRASKSVDTVERKLLGLTKSAKLLKREASGVRTFASALDVLGGTSLSPLISDITTVALIADPLQNAFSGALEKISTNSAVKSASEKAGSAIGKVTTSSIVQNISGVALGAGIALAFDQANVEEAKKIDQLSTADAKLYNDSFAKTLLDTGTQVMVANHLEGFFGPGFQAILTSLATKAGEAAAPALSDPIVNEAGNMATLSAHAFSEHSDDLVAAASNTGSDMGKALAAQEIWNKSAQAITNDLAGALKKNTSVIDDAMAAVTDAVLHPMELLKQESAIEGAIARINYLDGLDGTTGPQHTIFAQQKALLEAQWTLISGLAYDAGVHTAKVWANGYIQTWQGNTVNLPGFHGNTGEPPVPHGRGPGNHWMGGNVSAGETTWVGERGPEKVTFGRAAHITPASSNQPINVYVDGQKLFSIMDRRSGRAQSLATSAEYRRG